MKRRERALFIDIGFVALIFSIVFIIPVLFGSFSKNDKEIESNNTAIETVAKDNITESTKTNINRQPLVDLGTDLETVKVYISDTGEVRSIALEEYVIGVVLSEMPAAFEDEALMAQSILARTYVISKKFNSCSKSNKADICDTVHCQAYTDPEDKKKEWGSKGDEYYEKIRSAVEKTKGLIVSYEGAIIKYPQYFATSSGKTEEAESVFSMDIPYLQSVESPGEEEAPKYESSITYSKNNFINILKNNLSISDLTLNNLEGMVEILSRNTGDTVKEIKVGTSILTGIEFRQIFGLNSANFSISFQGDNVIIDCRGYGHGVGMSQWGANAMAKNGSNYTEIIKHYFKGSDIINLNNAYLE
ncbi:MAG: stage II sporulation protein D [Clostridium perfringens]|nr:stage II sporulation protein D [Clostridium perfringens]